MYAAVNAEMNNGSSRAGSIRWRARGPDGLISFSGGGSLLSKRFRIPILFNFVNSI